MTGTEVINMTRQNMADKLSGNEVVAQIPFLQMALSLYVLPDLVTKYDWSWKFDYVDQVVPPNTTVFTPDMSSFGAGVLLDDLYAVIFKTGNLGTTKKASQRAPRWFLDHYPDPTLEGQGRADWCTMIGGAGGSRQEVWLSQPTDQQYTLRLMLYKTLVIDNFEEEIPFRKDKHMLLVAGLTSFGFASIEQIQGEAPMGQVSPAAWWATLYSAGLEAWWKQDQSQSGVETRLGFFRPRGTEVGPPGEYWANPMIRSLRG